MMVTTSHIHTNRLVGIITETRARTRAWKLDTDGDKYCYMYHGKRKKLHAFQEERIRLAIYRCRRRRSLTVQIVIHVCTLRQREIAIPSWRFERQRTAAENHCIAALVLKLVLLFTPSRQRKCVISRALRETLPIPLCQEDIMQS